MEIEQFNARPECVYGVIPGSSGFAVKIAPKRKIACRCNAPKRAEAQDRGILRRVDILCTVLRPGWFGKPRMDGRTSIHLPQRRALSVGCSFR